MEDYLHTPATLPDFLSDSDTENELSPEVTIKEEMIEEVMQELYKEIAWPTATAAAEAATFKEEIGESEVLVEAPVYMESGKSESCGASMSETESTVMAGVKFAEGNMWLVVEDEDEWLKGVIVTGRSDGGE